MTWGWPWTLNGSKVPYIDTSYLSLRSKVWSIYFSLRPASSTYKVVENRKCTKWPQNGFEHVNVKSTLYKLSAYHRGLNFDSLGWMNSHFWDTRLSRIGKIGIHWITSKWTWTLNSQSTMDTVGSDPRGPNFGPFHSRTIRFRYITHFIISHWQPR